MSNYQFLTSKNARRTVASTETILAQLSIVVSDRAILILYDNNNVKNPAEPRQW